MNLKKIVYEDNKVLIGYILSEDEFTYNIEAINTKDRIVIGKRAIVKISNVINGMVKVRSPFANGRT